MSDISWNSYLTRVGGVGSDEYNSVLDAYQDFYVSAGGTIQSAFQDHLDSGGFNALLNALEAASTDASGNFQDVFINGQRVNFSSFFAGEAGFDLTNGFSADWFRGHGFQSIQDVAFVHFVRNILNTPMTYAEIVIAGPDEYTWLPDDKNAFHSYNYSDTPDIGSYPEGNEFNFKVVSADGLREYIFRVIDGEFVLIDDPRNAGSYNFYSPDSELGHLAMDVISWQIFGNNVDDPSVYEDRDSLIFDGVDSNQPDRLDPLFPETLEGDADNNFLIGEIDHRYAEISGLGGDDTLIGGPQEDVLNGGPGTDTASYVGSPESVAINLGENFGHNGDASWDEHHETLLDIENLIGSSSGDILVGDAGPNQLAGGLGNDQLFGQGGSDTLLGGDGDDLLNPGPAGPAFLTPFMPGLGVTEIVDGGVGDDTVTFFDDTIDDLLDSYNIFAMPAGSDHQFAIQQNPTFGVGNQVFVSNVEWAQFNDEIVPLADQATEVPLEEVIPAFLFAGSTFRPETVSYTGSIDAIRLLPDGWQITDGQTTVGIDRGIFLSSGGLPGDSNTSGSFSVNNGEPGHPLLEAAAIEAYPFAGSTYDASVIEFTFDSSLAGNAQSVRFDLFFGSDEYPEFVDSSYVDIAGVFVNGENYALFNGDPGQPLSIVSESINTAGNFLNNTGGTFNTEYDGFSVGLTIVAPIQPGENTVVIGIADTGDSIYDSGLFVGNVQATGIGTGGSFVSVIGGDGVQVLDTSLAPELIHLGSGQTTIAGTPQELDGDIIEGWNDDDVIVFEGANFSLDDLTITFGSAIIDIDLDGDGTPDTTVTLEGNFEDATFSVETVDGATQITTEGSVAENYVTIAGTAEQHQELGLAIVVAEGQGASDEYTYQWNRDGEAIEGANGATYQLTQDDVGAEITAQVAYSTGFGGSVVLTSDPTEVVANVNDDPTGGVSIDGTVAEDETLTANTDALEDQDGLGEFSYRWMRDGTAIAGAMAATYVLTQEDVGSMISVEVSYTDGFGAEETVTSPETAAVENVNDAPTGEVTISGDATQGETLTAETGAIADEDGLGTFSFQWMRDGETIEGATGETYELVQADANTRISVEVSYEDGHSTAESLTSGETDPVVPTTIYLAGTEDSETLQGAEYDDTLEGAGGNDLLEGFAGNDQLNGGDGNDTLIGGDGNDSMVGGDSADDIRDVMYGGAGSDTMDGGYGNDELRGDADDDRLAGGFGADTVIGGTGNDTLTGSAFSDQIFGGDGDDFVNGGWGHDRVNGGAGADQFFHIGIFDHGSDWIQDYNAAEGDVLMFGNTDAHGNQFQINAAHRTSADGERAGDDDVAEAFVIYRPTGQIMWALVDGMGQDSINLQIGEQVFDLMA